MRCPECKSPLASYRASCVCGFNLATAREMAGAARQTTRHWQNVAVLHLVVGTAVIGAVAFIDLLPVMQGWMWRWPAVLLPIAAIYGYVGGLLLLLTSSSRRALLRLKSRRMPAARVVFRTRPDAQS